MKKQKQAVTAHTAARARHVQWEMAHVHAHCTDRGMRWRVLWTMAKVRALYMRRQRHAMGTHCGQWHRCMRTARTGSSKGYARAVVNGNGGMLWHVL